MNGHGVATAGPSPADVGFTRHRFYSAQVGRGRLATARRLRRLAPQGDGVGLVELIQRFAVALLGLISLTVASAAQPAMQCSGAQKPWMVAELLFGRGNVSDFNWTRFVDAEITPRFPDGLTVYDARGQWKNPQTGTISRERSKMVMIAMPPDAGNEAKNETKNETKLQEIIAAYKTRFKQQSVGLMIRPSCVSF
jgi:hypothetical protein